ncbi:MAG: YkgJ family cysteine cluster protein [Candidatus Hydrogenedentes bacterium]|nr:YkgJ family cysteine cluster protein [Candidatus Hydrogenedentota bacterium]
MSFVLHNCYLSAMGLETVHFKCHHCNYCCTKVICLPTPWDVIRIVKATGLNPYRFLDFLTPDQISEVPANDPTWLKCGGQRYLMALQQHNHVCHFLNPVTRLCGIYEARPILCRLFPFKYRESRDGRFLGFTLHSDVGCPRHRDGVVEVPELYALYQEDEQHQQDYQDLVRVFNRKRYLGKRPQDFVEMFIVSNEQRAMSNE